MIHSIEIRDFFMVCLYMFFFKAKFSENSKQQKNKSYLFMYVFMSEFIENADPHTLQ